MRKTALPLFSFAQPQYLIGMAKKLLFYRCPVCHSMVELIDNGGHSLTCCAQSMQLLTAKTEDQADEYHLPVITRRDGLLYVEVGRKPHPQSEDHQVTCIVLVTKQTVRRSDIKSNRAAATVFTDKDHGDVYAYCNVHGLFKVSF